MAKCTFHTPKPPTHANWEYDLREEDLANALNGKVVLQNACERILTGTMPAKNARQRWDLLAASNKHQLEFVGTEYSCLPKVIPPGKTAVQAPDTLHVGKHLQVPIDWPTKNLTQTGVWPGPSSSEPDEPTWPDADSDPRRDDGTQWKFDPTIRPGSQQTIPLPNGGGKKITMPGGKVIQMPSPDQSVPSPQPEGQPEWSGTVAPEDDQPGAAPAGQDEDDLVEAGAQPDVEQGPQTEDGEEESSTLLWILGGATLAGLGLWWMMGAKK